MGGVCIKGTTVRDSPFGSLVSENSSGSRVSTGVGSQKFEFSSKKLGDAEADDELMKMGNRERQLPGPFSFSDGDIMPYYRRNGQRFDSGELRVSKSGKLKPTTTNRTTVNKVSEVSTLLGRAGTAGLGKAVEVLDTLGSSMTSLNPGNGFVSAKGNRISIRAFEVANTIAKGANLFESLSKENIKVLKEEVLHSDGVQRLVSTDMEELLRIAAADKREELNMFSAEVARFGNLCKDPQWHHLDRYFGKLGSELISHKQLKEEAETIMQELMTLAQHTSELYHELHALDRFEQDYRRKIQEEESLHVAQRGESLTILRNELKHQRKLVRSLKKKSLWSKSLEEVMEKFVDIVYFLHQEISEAFGDTGVKPVDSGLVSNPQRLGFAGLALHYANIINQIDTVVSRPSYIPPNTRDTLYQGLPPGVKAALRFRLQSFHEKEELTVPEIKAEMEKTLKWMVPIAANTTKAHHGFGWVGEWANNGIEYNKKQAEQSNPIRIQTLHYAEKEKTEEYILELVTWLHHLVSQVKYRGHGFKSLAKSSVSPEVQKDSTTANQELPSMLDKAGETNLREELSKEDKVMLEEVSSRNPGLGLSKSQEFNTPKKSRKDWKLSKSSGHSPSKEFTVAAVDMACERRRALNVLDGVDTLEI